MRYSYPFSDFLFKSLDLGTKNKTPAVQHPFKGGHEFRPVGRMLRHQVEHRHLHKYFMVHGKRCGRTGKSITPKD